MKPQPIMFSSRLFQYMYGLILTNRPQRRVLPIIYVSDEVLYGMRSAAAVSASSV